MAVQDFTPRPIDQFRTARLMVAVVDGRTDHANRILQEAARDNALGPVAFGLAQELAAAMMAAPMSVRARRKAFDNRIPNMRGN